MQQLVGADPDDLERLAVRMDAASSNVDRIRSAVDVSVRRAPWNGRVADRFKADWSSQHAAALRAAAEFLTGASNSLRRNAEEQRNASGDPGSGRIRPADPTVCRVSPEDEIAYTRRQMQEELDRAPAWDHARRKRLEDFLAGDRQFLKYSDTPGDERIIEVHGDLSTAKKVIIHVPGIFTGLDDYRHGGSDDAEALYNSVKGRGDVVVISFADYDVPQNLVEAAGDHGAQTGAPQMQALVQRLHDDGFATGDISVVAHSYGSRVVGEAMKGGLDVGRVVALGSPGMGADSRAGLGSPNVDLYAGSAPTDYVDDGSLWVDGARFVSEAGRIIPGAGLSIAAGATADAYEGVHGPSPVDMAGVHRLDTGPAQGHLHYFQGRSLEHIIDAALDHPHGRGWRWRRRRGFSMVNEELSGMDISQIRSMARSMDGKADEMRRLVDQLTGEVERASWAGQDRERFVDEWRQRHAVALRRVADNLDEAARQARIHADAQERVSRASGGGSAW